jgi:hypothetical protein
MRFYGKSRLLDGFAGVGLSMCWIARFTVILAAFILAGFLAGCATPVNWQARVGVYSYDQALMDYGPPGSSAKLSDGSTVVEWLTERGEVIVTPGPYAYAPGYYGRGYYGPVGGGYSTTYFPAQFLRLTFTPAGKLRAWKEFAK